MSRRWATDTEVSQPQAAITGPAKGKVASKAYGRLLVTTYLECSHIEDRPKRLQVALNRLREEHLELPSNSKLATWKDEGMGYSVLHWAVHYSQHDMVEVLAHVGCNVNAGDCGQETPLFIACGQGDLDMVTLLVELGAWVNVLSKQDDYPLLVAAREGNPDVVSYLLRNGALAQPAWWVYWQAGMSGNVRTIEALLSAMPVEDGVEPEEAPVEFTVLEDVCSQGHTEVVHALLSGGLCPTEDEVYEAMLNGTARGHLGVVLALQEAACVLGDEKRTQVLHQAIVSNDLPIFDALLSIGGPSARQLKHMIAEPRHPQHTTLLHVACREADTRLVTSMVELHGWNKDALDDQRHSPLVYALRGHCFDTMTLAYLVKAARVSTEGLSEQHKSALMKRVSAAMAKPEWEEFLHWRHEYLVEKSQGKFAERRTAAAELEKVSTEQATQHLSLKDSPIPLCPISKVPMTEAMVAADGFVYQRRAIRKWVEDAISGLRPCYSPITGQVMSTILVPNPHVRAAAKQRIRW